MAGLSPKLPLTLDPADGYALNKDLKELSRQNMKMLILTNPGERMMDPEFGVGAGFGVGIAAYLFENNSPSTYSKIEARIQQQVAKYLPYINLEDIIFRAEDPLNKQEDNFLGLSISFSIKKLGIRDVLEVPINL